MPEQSPTMQISGVASALAELILERNLRKGHTIEIPSLGISLSLWDEDHPPTAQEMEEMEALRLEDVIDDAEMHVRHNDIKVPRAETDALVSPVVWFVREAYVREEISIDSFMAVLDQRVQELIANGSPE